MLRLMCRFIDMRTGNFALRNGHLKTVYVGPTRSLVQERVRDWSARMGSALGLSVREYTGDNEEMVCSDLDSADIICTTPEKFGKGSIETRMNCAPLKPVQKFEQFHGYASSQPTRFRCPSRLHQSKAPRSWRDAIHWRGGLIAPATIFVDGPSLTHFIRHQL